MRLPAIRAMRLNKLVPAVVSTRADAAAGLNKAGLFSATLGALTSGSSRAATLELSDLGRQLGVKEEDKRLWEGLQLGVCGLASADFRASLDEMKQTLQDAGLSLEKLRIVFNHAIIGLPKSKKLLAPIKRDLWAALLDAGLGADCTLGVESETIDFIAFQREESVWDVFSAFSAQLQLERTQTYNTPQLREEYLRQVEQLDQQEKARTEEATTCTDVEEVSPEKKKCYPVTGRKRGRQEGDVSAAPTKSARVGGAAVHPIDLIKLLEKVASK